MIYVLLTEFPVSRLALTMTCVMLSADISQHCSSRLHLACTKVIK